MIISELRSELKDLREHFKKVIKEKDTEIASLKDKVKGCEATFNEQDERLSSLEQAAIADELIVTQTGLEQSAATDKSKIAQSFTNKLRIRVSESDIEWARKIGKVQTSGMDRRPILFKMKDSTKRKEILAACKTVKPQFYVNESLTPYRRKLINVLREIRKEDRSRIEILFVKDGVIHAASNSRSKMAFIRTKSDLDAFVGQLQ